LYGDIIPGQGCCTQSPNFERNGSSLAAWLPETDAERNAIREQLERILSSPLFKNSKRYPTLLRFVVERSLSGHCDPLKERTLGIEVFGRDPDYDTNLDPVVRTTAVEIRKRIAQYYHEPGHEREIRIDFPPGTYVPEFRMPPKPAIATAPLAERKRRPQILVAALAVGALLVLAIAVARPWAATPALERFWAPVLGSPDPISVYIGGYPAEAVSGPVVSMMDLMRSERVAFSDSTALAKLIALLVTHKKSYRIRLQPSSPLDELKDGPAVLVGAFNNSFTLRLTGPLRFSFAMDRSTHDEWIQDRQNPGSRQWSHNTDGPYGTLVQDYAIVCRVVDPTTGKIVVTASGLAKFGTEAAGEFLTNPAYIEEIARTAPRDWDRKNMEIVITTNLVGRGTGPPRIVATYFW
jgi:hypothetical protein